MDSLDEGPRLRKALPCDAEAIHALHTRSVRTLCRPHYSQEQVDAWLKGRRPEGYLEGIERGEMYVAELEGRTVGFGHAVPGEILAVFVDPDFTGRGIGRQILLRGTEMAGRDHDGPLKLKATLNAVAFYRKFGFEEVGPTAVDKHGVDLPLVMMRKRGI